MIIDNESLNKVCQAARQTPLLALDTEFVRTRTYYPRLGLIQLYDGEQISLIDPLKITEWQPFINLLQDEAVLKFVHAGSEDLEIFLHQFNALPVPVIDTQILAAFTGQAQSIGFAALVEHYTQIVLDKSEARTDWLERPLTEKQCQYAAADVNYLLPVAHQLMKQVEASGWLAAAFDESQALCQRRRKIMVPQDAWQDITNASQLRPRQLAALRLLAAWRLEQARAEDLAVNFVIREENLWKVARYLPDSLSELDQLEIPGREIRCYGVQLLELVFQARAISSCDLPKPLKNLVDMPGYKLIYKAIKAQVATTAAGCGLTPELLASRRQIHQLLSWYWQLKSSNSMPELITGWRGDLLKTDLEAILADARL